MALARRLLEQRSCQVLSTYKEASRPETVTVSQAGTQCPFSGAFGTPCASLADERLRSAVASAVGHAEQPSRRGGVVGVEPLQDGHGAAALVEVAELVHGHLDLLQPAEVAADDDLEALHDAAEEELAVGTGPVELQPATVEGVQDVPEDPLSFVAHT